MRLDEVDDSRGGVRLLVDAHVAVEADDHQGVFGVGEGGFQLGPHVAGFVEDDKLDVGRVLDARLAGVGEPERVGRDAFDELLPKSVAFLLGRRGLLLPDQHGRCELRRQRNLIDAELEDGERAEHGMEDGVAAVRVGTDECVQLFVEATQLAQVGFYEQRSDVALKQNQDRLATELTLEPEAVLIDVRAGVDQLVLGGAELESGDAKAERHRHDGTDGEHPAIVCADQARPGSPDAAH